jgi:hypothetical protein
MVYVCIALSLFSPLSVLLWPVALFREHYLCYNERQSYERTSNGRDNDTNDKPVVGGTRSPACWLAAESDIPCVVCFDRPASEKYHMFLQFIMKGIAFTEKKTSLGKGYGGR